MTNWTDSVLADQYWDDMVIWVLGLITKRLVPTDQAVRWLTALVEVGDSQDG